MRQMPVAKNIWNIRHRMRHSMHSLATYFPSKLEYPFKIHIVNNNYSKSFALSYKLKHFLFTLTASVPVMRFCCSWSRKMMKGRPYSSKANVPGKALMIFNLKGTRI